MLFEVILTFEGLATDLAGKGYVVLVATLVYHEIVGLGETSLAVLADKVYSNLCPHHFLPTAKLPAVALCFHWHYREHLDVLFVLFFFSFKSEFD